MAHLEKATRGFALPKLDRKVGDVSAVSVLLIAFCLVRDLRPKSWLHSVLFNDVRPTNTSRAVPRTECLMKIFTQLIT